MSFDYKKIFVVQDKTAYGTGLADAFKEEPFEVLDVTGATATVSVKGNLQEFLKTLERYRVVNLDVKTESLEEVFMHYYGGENE